jgi:hypothetical protein
MRLGPTANDRAPLKPATERRLVGRPVHNVSRETSPPRRPIHSVWPAHNVWREKSTGFGCCTTVWRKPADC